MTFKGTCKCPYCDANQFASSIDSPKPLPNLSPPGGLFRSTHAIFFPAESSIRMKKKSKPSTSNEGIDFVRDFNLEHRNVFERFERS